MGRLFPLPGLSATPFLSQIPGLGMECHTCDWTAPVSCFLGLCLGRSCPDLMEGSELGRGVSLELGCPLASISAPARDEQPQTCPRGCGWACRGLSYRAAVPLLQDRVFQADRAWAGGDLILPAEGVPPTPQRPPSLHGESVGAVGRGVGVLDTVLELNLP